MFQLSLLFTGIISICLCSCAIQRSAEELEAQNSINKLIEEIKDVKVRSINNLWTSSSDNLLQSITDAQKGLNLTRTLIRKVKTFSNEDFEDSLFKRQLDRINQSALILEEDDFLRYIGAPIQIENILTNKNVCSFDDESNCTLAYIPDVKEIISKTTNDSELLYYWREWRDKNAEEFKNYFGEFIEITKKIALLHGRSKPSAEMYYLFDETNFNEDQLEKVMQQIQPFYKELHAYVRHTIKTIFGSEIVQPEGFIPHHLLEFALNHIKNESSAYQRLEKIILEKELTPQEAINATQKFFKNIEVPEFSNKLWSNFTRVKSDDIDGHCQSEVNDLFFEICPKINLKTFLNLFENIADIQYRSHLEKLPYGFNKEPCPGFMQAVSRAIKLSGSSPKYLQKIGFLTDIHLDDDFTNSYLLHEALNNVFQITIHFVNQAFKVIILDGKIESKDFNSVYWTLMEKYAGISQPILERNEHLNVAQEFFEKFSLHSSVKNIFGTVASYQIYQAMCEGIGQISQTGEGLWNCDFSSSLTVGKVLRETMSLGAQKSWFDITEALVGDVNLNASPLILYFKPLINKLEEENKNNAELPGWNVK